MQVLSPSFQCLAQSSNTAAVDLLLSMITDSDAVIRVSVMGALLERQEKRCCEAVLAAWDSLDLDCRRILRKRKQWLEPAVERALKGRGKDLPLAISATESLGLHSVVHLLVPIIETHPSELIRESASKTLLELVHQLGREARVGRMNSKIRPALVAALADSCKRYDKHRNAELVDAFLTLCTWDDAELRDLISAKSTSAKLIGERLQTTERVAIVELLTGFIRKRNVPSYIFKIMAQRDDEIYRDALLRTIGRDPASIVLRNLQEMGMPRCCVGGAALMDRVSPDHRAAAVHVYNRTHTNLLGYLRLLVAAVELGGPGCDAAVIAGLNRCAVPSAKTWLRAAIILSSGDRASIDSDPDSDLLERLIHLLDRSNTGLARAVRRVLEPLHAQPMLERLQGLPVDHRRAMGRIVMMVDGDAIGKIRDGLRHPVLKKRLAAISAADALATVDLLGDAFERIAREDHQDARVLACQVMANAESRVSLQLLNEMANLPPCPVRDAAIEAIEKRLTTLQK
ncbi:hypothetical protein Q31b_43630 [Novipirellula aureliae]|uniref:HEAT repeat protein n=1 Tax=Novipirellula aureliae TaxID=2527966 RepID=A0A5C6DN37_9BACT|nr:hypothetical protein [Novipirellula aureliae]TWU37575.1 hypothetical protein Q31b_43630 [Novipirellula aureliae]